MPVTPNIQILRIFERWPFSTRRRDEHRSRSQSNPAQLCTRSPVPAGTRPSHVIYLADTPVTIVDHGTSELNIQSQQSLNLDPDPLGSPLNRLRRRTSKWFANERAAKGTSTIPNFLMAFSSHV
ncbi:hypothetical protein KCU77_g13291, partial [Aureobasidium melanogenum]